MGLGPSGAPIYLQGKELTTHYQSSFVALYRILHELLQGWCIPVLYCIIFLVADHQTTSTTLSRIWYVCQTLRESQAVLALLLHPKREPPQQNVPCLLPWYARRPISWWYPFPERGQIPMACSLPLARLFLRDFCWSLLKLCCQHHGLEGTSSMDEEQLESTNAIRSIPLIFTFITGSTSSLCGEKVVLASRPLPHFPDTSMRHDLVAGTDNSVSLGVLFVICPWAAGSLWQSDWDLHICSITLRQYSVCRGLKVGPQAHEEELSVARPPQQQVHRPLLLWEVEP